MLSLDGKREVQEIWPPFLLVEVEGGDFLDDEDVEDPFDEGRIPRAYGAGRWVCKGRWHT
jgi:hypothetical protein